jgi:chromosome segregation ATPase
MSNADFVNSSSFDLVSNFQNQNYKRQIDLLEQKLNMNEREYQNKIEKLQTEVQTLSNLEIKLRNQLSNKDKAIYEFNNIIKDYQNELINVKKTLCLKEEKLSQITNEFNSIKCNCNNITLALSSREESHNKLENDLNQIMKEKNKSEQKIKELIEVMNAYSQEINKINKKNQNLEKQNFELKSKNDNLINDNSKLNYQVQSTEITNKNYQDDIQNLQKINSDLMEDNRKMKYDIQNLNNEIYELNQKYNLTNNELIHLKSNYSDMKTDKNKLETDLAINIKNNQNNINKVQKLENDIENIINDANDNIKMIINWIENYLGIFQNEKISVPELPINTSPNNRILFDQLKQKIMNVRDKVNNNLTSIQNYRYQIDNNMSEINDKFVRNIERIKNIYENLKIEIENNRYFQIYPLENNNKDFHEFVNKLDNLINQLLQFIYNSQLDKQNIINQNITFKNELNNIHQKYDSFLRDYEFLNKKYIDLENKNKDNNDIIYEDFENLKQEYKILEKKNKNLNTEIELKDLQINSLQQMVDRRNNLSSGNINSLDFSEKIKKLEIDNSKLINDNMLLVEENKNLKKELGISLGE